MRNVVRFFHKDLVPGNGGGVAKGGGALGSSGALKPSTHHDIAIFMYPFRAGVEAACALEVGAPELVEALKLEVGAVEHVAPSDDEVPIEDQPLPADVSPTALSSGYVADSDPEEDPKEDFTDYLADGGDDDDDYDDDNKEEESSEKEEEHLAPTDSVVATPPPLPRSPRTKVSFYQTHLYKVRKTVRHQPPMVASTEALIAKYAVAPTSPSPPPSPLSPWSSLLPHIPSPPLPLPSPPNHTSLTYVERACFTTLTRRFKVRESLAPGVARQAGHALTSSVDYEFIDIVDAIVHAFESRTMTVVGEEDRDALRAQVSLLTKERRYFCTMASSYKHEAADAHRAWARSESRSQAMKAQI
nr:hypothetical protein [Tanacetum cinerariifolium]